MDDDWSNLLYPEGRPASTCHFEELGPEEPWVLCTYTGPPPARPHGISDLAWSVGQAYFKYGYYAPHRLAKAWRTLPA